MKTLRRLSRNRFFSHARITAAVMLMSAAAAMLFMAASQRASAQPTARTHPLTPKFSAALAFDISPAVRNLPAAKKRLAAPPLLREIRPERGPRVQSRGHSGDKALQTSSQMGAAGINAPVISSTYSSGSRLARIEKYLVASPSSRQVRSQSTL